MTLKDLRKYINSLPNTLDNLNVVLEYPNGQGSSEFTSVESINYDDTDFIISYFKY